MKLADKVATVEARIAAVKAAEGARDAAILALGTAAAPDDEVLADGEAVVHMVERQVFASVGGKLLVLDLRGVIPVPPPGA